MIKYYRSHRGSFKDSLDTTVRIVSIDGLTAIKEHLKQEDPNFYSILDDVRIAPEPYVDDRLPKYWGKIEYKVVADFNGYIGQCIGFTNFK